MNIKLIPKDNGKLFQTNNLLLIPPIEIVIKTYLRRNPLKYNYNLNKYTHLCITSIKELRKSFNLIYNNYNIPSNILIDSIDSFIISDNLIRILRAFKFVGFKVFILSKECHKYWFIDEFI